MNSDVGETLNFVLPWVVSAYPVLLALAFGLFVYYTSFRGLEGSRDGNSKCVNEMPPQEVIHKTEVTNISKASKKKQQQADKWSKHNFTHDWLLTSLKGHTGPVLDMDFSANNKFLVTGAEDRAIFVWNTKNCWKERDHKFIRYNVDLDHASLLKWSPDSKAFIYKRHTDNRLEVCKVARRQDGWISAVTKSHTYPSLHKDDTMGIGIDSKGKYLMSCSAGTEIVLIDLKGTELARFETYLINNYAAKLSPCGKFVAASGFAPDVKVWEVQFTKTGEFKQVSRAFELTGHSSGVYDFAFNADTTKVATASKDGTWKLFDIKIEYDKGEEPHLLKSGKFKAEGNGKVHIALSPDGNVLAIASGPTVMFVNTINETVDKKITDIYPGNITKVLFDSSGHVLLTAGEKHVRAFRNVTGYRTAIMHAKNLLATSSGLSNATRDRLESTITTNQQLLKEISESQN